MDPQNPNEEEKDLRAAAAEAREFDRRATAAEERKQKMARVLELREKAKNMYSKRRIGKSHLTYLR